MWQRGIRDESLFNMLLPNFTERIIYQPRKLICSQQTIILPRGSHCADNYNIQDKYAFWNVMHYYLKDI